MKVFQPPVFRLPMSHSLSGCNSLTYIFKTKFCVFNVDFSVFGEISAEGDILDSERQNDDGIRESYVIVEPAFRLRKWSAEM